mgnify:CR=1 FL=1
MLIVYVGAVAVLFLFVVMMLNVAQQDSDLTTDKKSSAHTGKVGSCTHWISRLRYSQGCTLRYLAHHTIRYRQDSSARYDHDRNNSYRL